MKNKTIGLEDVYKKAIEVFDSRDDALRWYLTQSPAYDNKSPYELCRAGKCAAMFKILVKLSIL